MKAVIQRVKHASVTVEGKIVGKIEQGFLVLLGIFTEDTESECVWLANKVAGLRVFSDNDDKMNKSLTDIGGSVLVVPNFTVAGDCKKGNRPSFIAAMRPEGATVLFEKFKDTITEHKINVQSGVFGADMAVELLNDGPVTLIVEN